MNCHCGHTKEEHSGEPEFPGSTLCMADGCDCSAYDPNLAEDT